MNMTKFEDNDDLLCSGINPALIQLALSRATISPTTPKPEPDREKRVLKVQLPPEEEVPEVHEEEEEEPKKYNLRNKKPAQPVLSVAIKRKPPPPKTRWIVKKSKNSFYSVALAIIDTNTYHSLERNNPDAKKLIRLSNKSLRCQVEKFVHESKSYVALTWLTVVRIFEYASSSGQYNEVKRIPERYVHLAPNIITAMHYSNQNFYIARLDGGKQNKPHIEVRNLYAKLVHQPIYYDKPIYSIYSDDRFIYIRTGNDIINIHRKNLFGVAYFSINFSLFSTAPIVGSWVWDISVKTNTKMNLLSVTTEEVIVSHYEIFSHKIIQCYRFEGDYKIINVDKLDQLIIIHRNMIGDKSGYQTKIDFGFLGRSEANTPKMFIHESTINLKYPIIETKVHGENLYLLGYMKDKKVDDSFHFQVGCIYLPSLKPIWYTNVKASLSSHIVPHDNNIALIGECQQVRSIKIISTKKMNECKKCKLRSLNQKDKSIHDDDEQTILSNLTVHKNKYLEHVGTSIFKILPFKE